MAWLGANQPAFLESLFACGLLGAALAPVNHRLTVGEIRVVLDGTSPRVLIQDGALDAVPTPAAVRYRELTDAPVLSDRDAAAPRPGEAAAGG